MYVYIYIYIYIYIYTYTFITIVDVLHCPSWLLVWMLVDGEVQVALEYLWSNFNIVSTPGLRDCILGEEQTLLFKGTGGLEPKGCPCFASLLLCLLLPLFLFAPPVLFVASGFLG